MDNLITASQEMMMSSLQLLDQVNAFRTLNGENKILNTDFLKKVKDELDMDDATYDKNIGQELNARGSYSSFLMLTQRECLLIGMRESKKVRRNILSWIESLNKPKTITPALPDFTNPAVAAIAWAEQYQAAQLAIATKAEIGSRREATAMATASTQARRAKRLQIELDRSQEWSTVKRMEIITGLKFNWRLLKSACSDLGIEPKDVFDPNFGTVKAYHADVWREAYALDIKQ